jgi:general secretion pathway protein E
MRLFLKVSSARTQRTICLTDVPVVTFGRHPGNIVKLEDDRASRNHCVIEENNGQVTVTDLRSRNGTFLNGTRIVSEPMRPGDTLRVGGIQVELFAEAGAEDQTPPTVPAPTEVVPEPPAPREEVTWPLPPEANAEEPLPPPPEDRPEELPEATLIEGPQAAAQSSADEEVPEPAEEKQPARRSPARSRGPSPAPAAGAPLERPSLRFSQDDAESGAAGESDFEISEPGLRRGMALEAGLAPVDSSEPYSPPLAAREVAAVREVLAKLPGPADEGAEDRLQLINTRGQPADITSKGTKTEAGPAVIARLLLTACDRARASDLHIEPKDEDSGVRIRVDGIMIELVRLHRSVAQRVGNVIKVLCDLDIARSNVIQEGRFSTRTSQKRVEYRVSFAPSVYGQTLAVRVLDPVHAPQYIRQLGMPAWIAQNIQQVVRQDQGMLIVCGPTGSGKSTTLYAAVRDIDSVSRKVITIEDPPEFHIEGATQMGVSEAQGNTFASLLRSILRQDPDVVYVGEVRDVETARIALQASSTGHLVLTTVHARDAIGSIYRLLDLGVEPSLIAGALNLVLAQRLVRVLCPHCRRGGKPPFSQVSKAGRAFDGVPEVFHAVGCPRCLNTGYHGRAGIFELLNANEDLRDVIVKAPSVQMLRKALARTMFSSLRDSGYQLVAKGVTSLDEVDRVLGIE